MLPAKNAIMIAAILFSVMLLYHGGTGTRNAGNTYRSPAAMKAMNEYCTVVAVTEAIWRGGVRGWFAPVTCRSDSPGSVLMACRTCWKAFA